LWGTTPLLDRLRWNLVRRLDAEPPKTIFVRHRCCL
ncbi:unnamed protein product, partial [Sphacelaria rigidula]